MQTEPSGFQHFGCLDSYSSHISVWLVPTEPWSQHYELSLGLQEETEDRDWLNLQDNCGKFSKMFLITQQPPTCFEKQEITITANIYLIKVYCSLRFHNIAGELSDQSYAHFLSPRFDKLKVKTTKTSRSWKCQRNQELATMNTEWCYPILWVLLGGR